MTTIGGGGLTEEMRGWLAACGPESFVAGNVEIRRPGLVRIGNHSNIDSGFICTTALEVGDYVHIAPGVIVIGGERAKLTLGHFATIGIGSRVVCASDAYADGEMLVGPTIPEEAHNPTRYGPVVIEPLAVVTTSVTIMPGVRIGFGAMVAAGALVLKDVEPWTIVAGVPARPIREKLPLLIFEGYGELKLRPKAKILEAAARLGYTFPEAT